MSRSISYVADDRARKVWRIFVVVQKTKILPLSPGC